MDAAVNQTTMMNLFAVPVLKAPLGRALTDAETAYVRQQLQAPQKAISNFSSPNKNVLDAVEMVDLRRVLQARLDEYFTQVYNTSNDVKLEITQSWFTLTRKGDAHHTHTHPNSVVSGVFYIKLGQRDGINFYRNDDLVWYELLRKQDNYYNAHRYFIETKVGDIILFPSNIKHGVAELTEDVERVSLAFNTFFSGELGRPEFSNALKISLG